MHAWHSKPLGNSCYTSTPNTCHLMKSNQHHILVAYAYMTFWTFGELMLYMHSKYTTLHRMQIHSSRISLYICFSSHTRKYMYTNTSSIKSFSKTCHTSSGYACFCSIFLVSLPTSLQPQDLFMMLELQLTGLTLALPTRLEPQDLMFSVHDFVMLVLQHYMCSVFMLSHTQIISSHAFS
jgi:hypothetical protein